MELYFVVFSSLGVGDSNSFAIPGVSSAYEPKITSYHFHFPRCSAAEQKLDIPEGVLKKEVKTKEQKEKELEEDIRKKQEQLDKMQVRVGWWLLVHVSKNATLGDDPLQHLH